MSESGPTTAGSIVAKLRMDRDVWIADKDKTLADAREIGALRPTVKVDVDTAGAMAKLEALRVAAERAGAIVPSTAGPAGPSAGTAAKVDAVAAAERRLAAAVSAADTAFARAELAQMRLNDVRAKGVTEGTRLAAAELTASEAVKRLDAANERATLSENALAASQEKAARTALEKAAAEETAARSTVKANEANSTNVSRIGMITTAVGLLLPLMVPVAAGAIGIAGALGMMGVAGIFAVVGIKKEMEQGSAAGVAYSTSIGSLKANMSALAATSAVAMLSSFQRIVRDTNDAMPMLNRQIGIYSGLLGRSGGNLYSGSINGLRVLEPLLMSAGVYVERLTQKFDAWTSNGGLERFGSYALAVLPKVEDVLGALGTAVMHILTALAPLGTVGMGVLTGLAAIINGFPINILSNLIGTISWGVIAFKSWGFIAPMLADVAGEMIGLGAATTIATGPIGWIIAGIAGLAAIFAIASASQATATRTMEDYTAAVRDDSGAIGENVRQRAAKSLQESGALDLLKKLGISTQLATSATLGNKEALKEFNQQLSVAKTRLEEAERARTAKTGKDVLGIQAEQASSGAIKRITDLMASNTRAINESVDSYTEQAVAAYGSATALSAMADAAGVSTAAYVSALGAQTDTKAQLEKTTAAMFLQNDAAGLLKQSLDLLNGKTLGAEQAQNQFDSQIANMADHMNAAGKEIDRASTSLTDGSAAAAANKGELISLTSAAQASAQAFRDNGGSAEDTRKKLVDMKQAIIENAIAHGEDAGQVQAYVDKLFQIPATIPPTKLEIDTATAMAQLEGFLANVRSRVATIQVRATMPDLNGAVSGSGRPGVANGGTIGHLAGGGSGTVRGPGTADSDTAGLFRLADGEEVTSNKFGQADRYRGLLKQINAGVVPSTSSSTTVSTQPVAPVTNNHYSFVIQKADNPEAVYQQIMNRLNGAGAA